MEVTAKKKITDLHTIELGNSTWDANSTSIRNRHDLPGGRFSPRNSSEIPIENLVLMVEFAAEKKALDKKFLLRIIKSASEALLVDD